MLSVFACLKAVYELNIPGSQHFPRPAVSVVHLPHCNYVVANFLLPLLGFALAIFLGVIRISSCLFIHSAPLVSDSISILFLLQITPSNKDTLSPLHEVVGLLSLPTEVLDNIFSFCASASIARTL